MRQDMLIAKTALSTLLASDSLTADLQVRVHGANLVIAREEPFGPDGEPKLDDRIRFTKIGRDLFGLSVRRHTGRWEKTPFQGTLGELVEVMKGVMQHLIAKWS